MTATDTEVDSQVLATALSYADAAAVILDPAVLRATDFVLEVDSQIYTAMRACHERGEHGLAALDLELKRHERIEAQQRMVALLNTLPWTPTSEDVATWIKALQARRETWNKAHRVRRAMEALYTGNEEQARAELGEPATNGHKPPPVKPAPQDGPTIPELPDEAAAIYEHVAACAQWLDDYVSFAQQAAPMTPYAFHEAAALMAASVAVARRLVVRPATTAIYPNLFMLVLADSTIYSKTTGMGVLKNLFVEAELAHLLLPQRMTPEAFVQDLGTTIPSTLNAWDIKEQAQWLKERAVAAQRGWVLDEASRLFDSFKRDFNTGLLPLMLDLYECPALTREQTISRGRTLINDSYLSFFGAATPAAMRDHLQNKAHWTNGLWARFVLIVPDGRPDWCFFPPRLPYPPALLDGLYTLAYRFPMPHAAIEMEHDSSGQERQTVVVRGREPPSSALLGPGVWASWEAYCKALRHTLLLGGEVPPALYASYGRLGIHALKVAMLLAALDGEGLPVFVEQRHFARAQSITEQWRGMLHSVWGEGVVTEEATQSDRVLSLLAHAETGWLATRDIYRPLGIGAQEARALLEELVKAGQVEPHNQKAANGRMVEGWRLAIGVTR